MLKLLNFIVVVSFIVVVCGGIGVCYRWYEGLDDKHGQHRRINEFNKRGEAAYDEWLDRVEPYLKSQVEDK